MTDRALRGVCLRYLHEWVGEQGSREPNLAYPCTPRASVLLMKTAIIADTRSRKKVTPYGEFTLFHVFSWKGR